MIGHVVGYHAFDKTVSRHGPSALMLMNAPLALLLHGQQQHYSAFSFLKTCFTFN